MKKNICILGATGSIGTQALDIIRSREELSLYSFSYHRSKAKACEIMSEFRAAEMVQTDDIYEDSVRDLVSLVEAPAVDTVLHAISGTSGIRAAIAALRAGKNLALANKETLVAAGELVMREDTSKLVPVDSEHSAIYQCLGGSLHGKDVSSIVLTASGGAFRDLNRKEIAAMKAKDALKHPNWNMGRKITIDSATMMNKGLEVIEAMHLFGVELENVEVLIHPESIIHSMVRFKDGSLLAELSKPDMRQPISYALTGDKRAELKRLDFSKLSGGLTFRDADTERFPCLRLAFEAAKAGGIIPAVLNAANEVAVEAYLMDLIGFYDISAVIERVMDMTENAALHSLEQLEDAIALAKKRAEELL